MKEQMSNLDDDHHMEVISLDDEDPNKESKSSKLSSQRTNLTTSTCTSTKSYDSRSSRFQIQREKLSLFFSFDGNDNAKAVALAHIPRGAAFCALSVYFSVALVQLATQAAGCETEPPEGETEIPPCDKRILGLKPSSMLSIYILVLGISISTCLPIIGALLDSSKYRRGFGRAVSMALTTITFGQSFVSKENWIIMLVLQIFSSLLLEVEYCIVLAYIPELTNDEEKLSHYNVIFATVYNVTVLLFLVGMTVATILFEGVNDKIIAARIAMMVTFVLQLIFYSYSWTWLFGPNTPRKNSKKEGNFNILNFISSGLKHVGQTICKIFKQRREVKWCLISRAFTQAANIGFVAAILSYLTDVIHISSRNLGIATLILLATAILGNQVSIPVSKCLNPLRSLQICLFIWCCFSATLSFLVYEPGHETRLFFLTLIWGISTGWKEPTEKTLWCQLVPQSSTTEMMGLFLFFSQILAWLPPLVFTALNEAGGVGIQIALSSFGVYFLIGIGCLFLVGDYGTATKNTKTCEEEHEAKPAKEIEADQEVKDEEDLKDASC